MAGECEMCGCHSLQCNCESEKRKDIFKVFEEFDSRQTRLEDFAIIFEAFKYDIWSHIETIGKDISNNELRFILRVETLSFFINKLQERPIRR